MTQIEQIKAEIERRRMGTEQRIPARGYGKSYYVVMSELLDIITNLPQEQPSEDLEKVAYDYTNNTASRSIGKAWLQRDVRLAFIRGAQWQKEQLMKGAYVESQIVEDGRIELEGEPLPCLNPIILLPYPQFKPNNKVKVIIIKED